MAEPKGVPNSGPPPTPRWVKALAIGAIVVIVVVVVVLALVGGNHGPGMHGG